MPGVLLLMLGPAVALFSPRFEQAASIDARAEAGSAAQRPGDDPEATFAAELIPGIALRLTTPRSRLELQLDPRLYYRNPNLGDVERPLVLGRAGLAHGYQATRNLLWSSRVRAAYGELDYTSTDLAFAAPVAGELPDAVLTTLSVQGATGIGYRFTERNDLGVEAAIDHTESRGSTTNTDLPETTSVSVTVGQRYLLDQRSSITFAVRPEQRYVSPGSDFLVLANTLSYARALSQRTRLDAAAGVIWVKETEESVEALPSALLSLEHVVLRRRFSQVTNRFRAALDAPLDPSTGDVNPALSVEAGALSSFGEHWSVACSVAGSTLLTERDDAPVEDADTSISASGSMGYRFSENAQLEWGVRYQTRLQDAFGSNAETVDPQTWAFLRLLVQVELGPAGEAPALP